MPYHYLRVRIEYRNGSEELLVDDTACYDTAEEAVADQGYGAMALQVYFADGTEERSNT